MTMTSPVAAANPQAIALPLPLRVWVIALTDGSTRRATSIEPSVELPSTTMISWTAGRTAAIAGSTISRFLASFRVGTITLTSGNADRRGWGRGRGRRCPAGSRCAPGHPAGSPTAGRGVIRRSLTSTGPLRGIAPGPGAGAGGRRHRPRVLRPRTPPRTVIFRRPSAALPTPASVAPPGVWTSHVRVAPGRPVGPRARGRLPPSPTWPNPAPRRPALPDRSADAVRARRAELVASAAAARRSPRRCGLPVGGPAGRRRRLAAALSVLGRGCATMPLMPTAPVGRPCRRWRRRRSAVWSTGSSCGGRRGVAGLRRLAAPLAPDAVAARTAGRGGADPPSVVHRARARAPVAALGALLAGASGGRGGWPCCRWRPPGGRAARARGPRGPGAGARDRARPAGRGAAGTPVAADRARLRRWADAGRLRCGWRCTPSWRAG